MDAEKKRKNPLFGYFTSAASELRKVTWPTPSEAWQKVQIVIIFSIIFALFLGSIDYLLNGLIQLFLD